MALDAATLFEIRDTGHADNGGGFADLNPGVSVDYSQQNGPKGSWADLAMTAGGTTLTSATGGFTAAMDGNVIYIKSGTNFTPGYYQMTGFNSAASIEIDRDATNGTDGSGGSGRLGGAVSVIIDTLFEDMADGNIAYIKKGTYNSSGNIVVANEGSYLKTIHIRGYNALRDDMPAGADRPLIACGAYNFSLPAFWQMENIRFTTSHADGIEITGGSVLLRNCSIEQQNASNNGITLSYTTDQNTLLLGCEVFNSAGLPTGTGIVVNGDNAILDDCEVYNFDIGVDVSASRIDPFIYQCKIRNCITAGITLSGGNSGYIKQNTIYDCDTGIDGGTADFVMIRENLIDTNTTVGVTWSGAQVVIMDWNNWHGNGSDISGAGVAKGDNATAVDPEFRDAPNGDLRLHHSSALFQSGFRLRVGVG